MLFEDIIDVLWDLIHPEDQYVTCKFCGKNKLKWKETAKGWRLYRGRKQHICKQYKRNSLKITGPKLIDLTKMDEQYYCFNCKKHLQGVMYIHYCGFVHQEKLCEDCFKTMKGGKWIKYVETETNQNETKATGNFES